MTELPLGAALLVWSIVVHLVGWRIKLPTNHTRTLLAIFALAPAPAVAAVALVHAPWLPADVAAWLRLALLYIPGALAYIVCYSAIEHESATLALCLRLAAAGGAGMTRESVREWLGHEDVAGGRLESMCASGLIRIDASGCALTQKGRVLARLFSCAERAAGLPGGG